MRMVVVAMLSVLAAIAGGAVHAQAWPSQPVRIIVTQPPGNPSDTLVRMFADYLARQWERPVIVDNRPGGASLIGIQAVARAPSDGYTLLFTTGGIILNKFMFKTLPYDAERDLQPVVLIGRSPFILAINNSVPATTVREFIAELKAHPDKYSYASDGPRGISGMMASMFNVMAGTRAVHVPYNGGAAALQDTLAGRTQFTFQSAVILLPHVKAGKIRPLAVSSANPVVGVEQVPLLKEALPGFEYMGSYFIYAPSGVAQDIVLKVNRDIGNAMKDPQIAKRLADMGPIVDGGGPPEAVRAFQNVEEQRLAKMIKAVGLLAE
jgi:tripartite-type tricarboxylate transporter receptor subunit TctC